MKNQVLDHIDNISIDETFPIKNIQALEYLRVGLYTLAVTVREEEVRFFKETRGTCHISAFGGIDKISMLMNYFNWFSIDLINYLRLIAFIDYINKNNIESDIEMTSPTFKKEIKIHCKNYVKDLIPEILTWRNKLSAHHSITDPFHDDNIATFHTSLMNNIIYRNPYYEAGGFTYHYEKERTKIEAWRLTEIYEKLSTRFWPELKLTQFPDKDEITGLFRVLSNNKILTNEEKVEEFKKIILENKKTENQITLEELSITYFELGCLLKAMNKIQECIDVFNELALLHKKTTNDKILYKISQGIIEISTIYDKKGDFQKSYEQYMLCINLFKESKNEYIILSVCTCYLNLSYNFYKPGMNNVIANKAIKDGISLINSLNTSNPHLILSKAKLLINEIAFLTKYKIKDKAIELCDEVLSLKGLTDDIILEQNKATALKISIENY